MTISRHLNRPLAGIVFGTVLLGAAASAQAPDQPPAAAPPSSPPPAANSTTPLFRPGFIDAFGRLIEQGVTNMSTTLGKMNENAKDAGDAASAAAAATRDAAGGLMALPSARMIGGHELCETAPNGAPDCAGAVAKICRAEKLSTGRSMDVVTAEVCPNSVLLARRYGQPEPEPCRMESYVTKALCQ